MFNAHFMLLKVAIGATHWVPLILATTNHYYTQFAVDPSAGDA